MKKVELVFRILLGIMILVFGLNKFLNFIPMPPHPGAAGEFMGALAKSGYIFPIVAIVEISTGILLLVNKYKALALIVLFPVMLNAFLFHAFLDLPGIGAAAFAVIMNGFLMFREKESYQGLLKA
jgi:putative oxidoreductase